MKKIFIFLIMLSASELWGQSEISIDSAFGKDSYRNYSMELRYSTETYYISPGFESYESDDLYRRNVYSFSFGFYSGSAELDFSLSLTPEMDGYKNYSAGSEFYYQIYEGESFFLKPGAFISGTWHSDQYSSTSTLVYSGRNKTSYSIRTTPFELRETEYGLALKTGFEAVYWDMYYSRTSYNKEISLTDRALQSLVSNASSVAESGFADYSWGASLSVEPWADFNAGLAYSYCAYLLGEPSSRTYRVSISKTWDGFEPGLFYEYNESASGSGSIFGFSAAFKL